MLGRSRRQRPRVMLSSMAMDAPCITPGSPSSRRPSANPPEFVEEQASVDSHVWDFIIEQTTAYAETFTAEQLEMIVRFVTRAADITHRATTKLTAAPPVTGE